jgi:hypothetical protein
MSEATEKKSLTTTLKIRGQADTKSTKGKGKREKG